MQVTYARRWNLVLNQPLDPLDPETARRLDGVGDPYAVVFGDPGSPAGYIELNWSLDHLAVFFLDGARRPWLEYTFTRLDAGRMFMDGVLRWEYPDGAAAAMRGATLTEKLRYRQDGEVERATRDDLAREVRRQRITGVDLGINWEPVSRFGEWDSVARLEREPLPGS